MPNYEQEYTKELESTLAYKRSFELDQNPIKGNFDAEHLKSIHKHIYQDFEKYKNMPKYEAGQFRNFVPENETWFKERTTFGKNYVNVYSDMDKNDLKLLDDTLKKADPKQLQKLNKEAFAKELSNIYSTLDYIHPFKDGNSRTLRTFTSQLAHEANYNIEWENLGQEELYRARDIGTNKIGSEHTASHSKRKHQEIAYKYIADKDNLQSLFNKTITVNKEKEIDNPKKNVVIKSCEKIINEQYKDKETRELALKRINEQVNKALEKNKSLPDIKIKQEEIKEKNREQNKER